MIEDTTQLLLDKFLSLPKSAHQPTYLELCHYPKRRFEEICSRLLAFYLQPNEQHGLSDLFLAALLRLAAPEHTFTTPLRAIKVEREIYIEGKRLDLLVHSREFALGIENKITARLYNPLDL